MSVNLNIKEETMGEWDELSRAAEEAARVAGVLLRKEFGRVRNIREKQPNDFVTEMDLRSEDAIRSFLFARFPNSRIISEERTPEEIEKGLTWVVDPLDGTKNYIHGFPFVCVSVAAMVEGKVRAGAVYDFLRDEMFSAAEENGACLNGNLIRVSGKNSLSEAMISTGFPFRAKKYIDVYLQSFKAVFNKVAAVRRAGSAALDLCYTACGIFDGFWEIGLSIWDVAAASLVLREAGGIVSDFDGRNNYLYTGNIVGASSGIYQELFDIISPILGGDALQGLSRG